MGTPGARESISYQGVAVHNHGKRRVRRLTPRAALVTGAVVLVTGGVTLSASADNRGTSGPTNRSTAYAPSNISPPSIAGNAVAGQTLTETHGSWSGSPTSFHYQWVDCDQLGNSCAAVLGATGQTYVVTATDVGHTLRVLESATNPAGTSQPATSTQTLVVTATAPLQGPVNTAAPTIAGNAISGSLLTASTGTWSGAAPLSYAYQWQRCAASCVNIAGATGSSYKPVDPDIDSRIRAVVTASNSAGHAQSSSQAVGPVIPSAAEIKASLLAQIKPHGPSSRKARLLHKGKYVLSFSPPSAGTLLIQWYYLPHGAVLTRKTHKPILVASGKASFPSHAVRENVTIKITSKGKQLLKRGKKLKLTVRGTFTPTGGTSVSATKKATLKKG